MAERYRWDTFPPLSGTHVIDTQARKGRGRPSGNRGEIRLGCLECLVLSLVSHVDSFCNLALNAALEVPRWSAICGCYPRLLVVPLHSHMSYPLSSLACVILKLDRWTVWRGGLS